MQKSLGFAELEELIEPALSAVEYSMLQTERLRYSVILNTLEIALFEYFPQIDHLEANSSFYHLTGSIRGEGIQALLSRLDSIQREELSTLLSNGQNDERLTLILSFQVPGIGSQYLQLSGQWRVFDDSAPAPLCFTGILQDISSKLENERTREHQDKTILNLQNKLESLSNQLSAGFWDYDTASKEERWDLKMYALFNTNSHLNHNPQSIRAQYLPPKQLEQHHTLLQSSPSASGTYSTEYSIILEDGTTRYLQEYVYYFVEQASRRIQFLGICQDKTNERITEIHLRSLIKERLRDSEQIVKLLKLATAAQDAKKAFFTNVQNELISPLNSILGFANILAEGLSGEQQQFAQIIEKSGNKLAQRIHDLMEYAAVAADKQVFSPQWFNISELVAELTSCLVLESCNKGITIHSIIEERVPETLYGDSAHLLQILKNLIDNAIKFTETGEIKIIVSSPGYIRKDGHVSWMPVRFEIQDSGIGIPQTELPHIFETPDKGTTAIQDTEISGIGLSVARVLAELMGGEIGVNSLTQKGSSFWLLVPFRSNPEVEELTDSSQDALHENFDIRNCLTHLKQSNLNSMLITDKTPEVEIILAQLESLGIETLHVTSKEQALSICADTPFNAILLDTEYIDNSKDFASSLRHICSSIRAKEYNNTLPIPIHVPLIALTSEEGERARSLCRENSLDDYIHLPLDNARLAKILERCIYHTLPTNNT